MLSSAVLQIIAMLCMLIDHVGAYLMNDFWLFRVIGRLAMPLFVFGLAEGFIHTSSRKKYFVRIAICALITEVVLYFLQQNVGYTLWHNILLNFVLAFISLICVEKRNALLIFVPIMAGFAEYLKLDYGWAVIVLAIGFYLTLKYTKKRSVLYFAGIATSLLLTNALLVVIGKTLPQMFAVLAFIPLMFYDGKKGHRLPKWFGYAFYPAHLFLILIIRLLFY